MDINIDINDIVKERGVLLAKIDYLSTSQKGIACYQILDGCTDTDKLDTIRMIANIDHQRSIHVKRLSELEEIIGCLMPEDWSQATGKTLQMLYNSGLRSDTS